MEEVRWLSRRCLRSSSTKISALEDDRFAVSLSDFTAGRKTEEGMTSSNASRQSCSSTGTWFGIDDMVVLKKDGGDRGDEVEDGDGSLNWFMIRLSHGMFNPNPLRGMICGMVQKMSNALLFDRCA